MNVKLEIKFIILIFSGAWTPRCCEFTRKMAKFQQNEHTPNIWLITYFFWKKMNIYYVYYLIMII